jgi:deoxyribonuclease-1
MEADLHNLRPAIGEINGDRSNFRFATLEGEERRYGSCDFEVDFKGRKAEPRPEIRGDIARTYFYMRDQYGLTLSRQQTQLLVAWNRQDPVGEQERTISHRTAAIQGNANHYVTGTE